MEQVQLIPLLKRLGFNGRQCAAVGSIIARMAAPGSERATYRWLQQRSALGELLEVDFESMGMMQLYRVSDLLHNARKEIENYLFNQVTDLFGLEVTVTLYDLTNTYFEGVAAAQPTGATRPFEGEAKRLSAVDPVAGGGRQRVRAPVGSAGRQYR